MSITSCKLNEKVATNRDVTITSSYNGFGQLLTQTDAKGTVSQYQYDVYGRSTQIIVTTADNETSTYIYEYDANSKRGTLSRESVLPENTSISYTYDNFLRQTSKTYQIGDLQFAFKFTYNNQSQLDTVTYPSGLKISHTYFSDGALLRIPMPDNTPYTTIFPVFSSKPLELGKLTYKQTGKVLTDLTYNKIGQLTQKRSIVNGANGAQTRQDWNYTYDNVGRMISRQNLAITPDIERFTYDKQDRLTAVRKNSAMQMQMNYNQNLISSNSTVGTYQYGLQQPHALSFVNLNDSNKISLNRCDLTYTPFHKVDSIHEGDNSYKITYYPNNNKATTSLYHNNTLVSQKYYAGKSFEWDSVTNTSYNYVYAYGEPVAVFIQRGGDMPFEHYPILTDHLGSIDMITNHWGEPVDSMSFDVWGNRRDRLDWSQPDNSPHLIDRGFTMHQHLDTFALINMGGRMYDPVVQQFLSVDPYVQLPDRTQNFNRYAYCINNPITLIDPEGLFATYSEALTYSVINNIQGNIKLLGGEWHICTPPYAYFKDYSNLPMLGKGIDGVVKSPLIVAKNYVEVRPSNNSNIELKNSQVSNNQWFNSQAKNNQTLSPSTTGGGGSLDINITLGLGFSIEFGYIFDSEGKGSFFYSYGLSTGFEASIGLNVIGIPNTNFKLQDFSGQSASLSVNINYLSLGLISDLSRGATKDYYFNQYGGFKIGFGFGAGASLSNTKTILLESSPQKNKTNSIYF